MTYIASVIARNGIAIIADSLVTSTRPVLEYEKFSKYIGDKKKDLPTKTDNVKLDAEEIVNLFEYKPSHTKDYEDKLFEYDKYLAVTTSGQAVINGKRIGELIETIKIKHHRRGYALKKIETKIKDFCEFLEQEVIADLKSKLTIGKTTFIFSSYDKRTKVVSIYRVWTNKSSVKDIGSTTRKLVEYKIAPKYEKVVCDGQNKISRGMLFGEIPVILSLIPIIATAIAKDFTIDQKLIDNKYLSTLQDKIITPDRWDAMNMFKLTGLSLQQAVDLANLLMSVEIDFQKYTKNIPTVGGVIKLAVIDKDGFRPVMGFELEKPNNI